MSFVHRTVLAVVAALPLLAEAQGADPANPAAIVAAPHYDSPFKAYRPFTETDVAPDQVWRAANEEMARLRGHAGHVNAAGVHEAAPSSPAALPNEASSPPAQPAGHGMHHGHGGN